MRKPFILIATGLAAALPLVSAAQQPKPAAQAAKLDPRSVVAEVRRVISDQYVLPERRPVLDAALAQGLASGRYDVTDPGTLAERINADLEKAGRDKHLNFAFDPGQAAILAAGSNEAAPDQSGYERQARAANHGISELRVLPGNIRYMDYRGFHWIGPESAAALENAMRFLAGGEAIIIDIRRNGGGSPLAVQYLTSHFLPADKPLVTFYMNGQPQADRLSTLAELPAGRLVDKPLYVLTSDGSASAAEEFAGHVGGYKFGELVGSKTAGAGFRNSLVPIDGRFVLSVSVGRAVLASTGKDWEAVGIPPTIAVATPLALDAAQAHALRRVAAKAPAQERDRLEKLAQNIAARMEPRPAALPLTAYAGRFGERAVTAENGRLYYRRGEGLPTALVPIGGNRFIFDSDPAVQVEFASSGDRVGGFAITRIGEPAQGPYQRTQ